MRRRLLILAAVPAALALLAGCEGGPSAPEADTATAPGPRTSSADLQRAIGNGFREGLSRLAVMQQRGDDATDLGQPLTPGLLDRVRCSPGAGRAAAGEERWRCDVRWQTVSGVAQWTRYEVRVLPGGCFGAGATPPRPSRYDPTIRAYSEDPLNALVSADPTCS